jgi:membrane protein implicated in regulation of membrane protease activity
MLETGRAEMPQGVVMEAYVATYWMWWALAAVLVGAELFTGTFYLLAVGGAFVLGGVVAWFGGSTPAQLLIGGVFAVAGTFAAHRWRKLRAMPPPQPGLDVGQEVQVLAWNDNGTARVSYRGTQWDATVASPSETRARTMYIVDTRGSTLVIASARS